MRCKLMKKSLITIAAGAAIALTSASPALADPLICHNGVLSDDAGQNCADGLYEQVYGSAGNTSHTTYRSTTWSAPSPSSGGSSNLQAIAQCESGGNPSAVSPGGQYRGMYQFSYSTWQSVGGSGDPAAASVQEQTMRAQTLYSQQGSSPWPVCGR